MNPERINQEILRRGQALAPQMLAKKPSLFESGYFAGAMLEWAMQEPDRMVRLFRLVDVLPTLQTPADIAQHLDEYLLQGQGMPGFLGKAFQIAGGALGTEWGAKVFLEGIRKMAEGFIVGRTPAQALESLLQYHQRGVAFTADILGEACLTQAEAESFAQRYQDFLLTLSQALPQMPPLWKGIPTGNLSIKISSLYPSLKAAAPQTSVQGILEKLRPLALLAKEKGIFLNLDMEQLEFHEINLLTFEALALDPALKDWPHVGLVLQAYLKRSEEDLAWILRLAKLRGIPFTVRLVKGAYWDYEVIQAQKRGREIPVWTQKAKTDQSYERITRSLLENHRWVRPAFASHNLRSLLGVAVMAEELGLTREDYEFQMLQGMAEPMREALVEEGYRMRLYSPIGEMLPGMSYLVRRLLENTSNQSFLRQSFYDQKSLVSLLQPPQAEPETIAIQPGFGNAREADYSILEERQAFQSALERLRQRLPLEVPLWIAGKALREGVARETTSPNDTTLVVTRTFQATQNHAKMAVESSFAAFREWDELGVEKRAKIALQLADLLEAHRAELCALECIEVAKPWAEADGDVVEAIDFCRYYAQQGPLELLPFSPAAMAGEENQLFYVGRGPTLVIAPWNFPIAILTGMAIAALVAGNPVILKPASTATACAGRLVELMWQAGFPEAVVQFVPGSGALVGEALAQHPLIAQIAFTGSKEVGLQLYTKAAQTQPGQPQLKRMIAELGGKNAILVDADAEPDEAIAAVLKGAFGFSGQKCSACSRLLIHQAIYEPFVERLIEATRRLVQAPSWQPDCDYGPLVEASAQQRLQKIVQQPPADSKMLFSTSALEGGYFVPASLFEVQHRQHPLLHQELFGPLVTLLKVQDFTQGLEVALDPEYRLTGAVFTRLPSHLEAAKRAFRVGNLYLNQTCTGAKVGRHPFGGFGMSGLGTKAGGPGYLRNFADPRSFSENTMRRGFASNLFGEKS